MSITFDELRKSLDLALRTLEEKGERNIDFDSNYYWSFYPEQEFDFDNKPTNFTLGDLEEDAAELKKVIESGDNAIPYSLSWLASILRYMAVRNLLR